MQRKWFGLPDKSFTYTVMKITPQAKAKLEYLPFVAGVDRMQHTVAGGTDGPFEKSSQFPS